MYINIIHQKKIQPKIPTTIFVLKYICKFSNFIIDIIMLQIYFICSIFPMFVKLFRIINCFKSKANHIYLKQTKIIHNVMSIHCKKINYNWKIIFVTTTIFEKLIVFSSLNWNKVNFNPIVELILIELKLNWIQ
jgi:hypothetical protein